MIIDADNLTNNYLQCSECGAGIPQFTFTIGEKSEECARIGGIIARKSYHTGIMSVVAFTWTQWFPALHECLACNRRKNRTYEDGDWTLKSWDHSQNKLDYMLNRIIADIKNSVPPYDRFIRTKLRS